MGLSGRRGAEAARFMESTSRASEDMDDLNSCKIANISRAMLGPGIAVVGRAVGLGGACTVDVEMMVSDVGGIAGMNEGNLGRRGVTEGLRSMFVMSAFSGSTPVGEGGCEQRGRDAGMRVALEAEMG